MINYVPSGQLHDNQRIPPTLPPSWKIFLRSRNSLQTLLPRSLFPYRNIFCGFQSLLGFCKREKSLLRHSKHLRLRSCQCLILHILKVIVTLWYMNGWLLCTPDWQSHFLTIKQKNQQKSLPQNLNKIVPFPRNLFVISWWDGLTLARPNRRVDFNLPSNRNAYNESRLHETDWLGLPFWLISQPGFTACSGSTRLI